MLKKGNRFSTLVLKNIHLFFSYDFTQIWQPKNTKGASFMYIRQRANEGIPGGLYRKTSEILRDMSIIENKISEVESKLSVRNLISTIIESDDPEKDLIDESTVSTLEAIIEDAERSLFHLERLRTAMNYLEEELSQVRWLMKKNA